MVLRFSITRKFILAFLVLSIIPLCILGIITLQSLRAIGQRAIDSSTAQLEHRAREALELRVIELANRVSQSLHSCETDLLTLKMLPIDAAVYQKFSLSHRRTIWTREGTNEEPIEIRKDIPLYREIAFIGPDGIERVRILDDQITAKAGLRDVSKPENTTYKSERYFSETRELKADDIHVTHLTGWYVTRDEQLGRAARLEDAVEGKKYEGVIRFSSPLFARDGRFEGILVLSLDHRHLMELTLHILPTEERFIVFPSYSSGNYAFMFDDEGWIISHPKFFDIRGLLPDGTEFDPRAPAYARERLLEGKVPFNLDHVSFINPNYPFIAQEVREGRSGVTSTFNVGGTPRVMAYAPIFFDRGPYSRFGIFGGITIGVETAKFREPALLTGAKIDEMVTQTKWNSLIILGATAFMAVLFAILLARTVTRPILNLAGKASEIAAGSIPSDIAVHTGDELELLAMNFATMARQIREHRENLEGSLEELSRSKKSMEQYSRELEKQLRVMKNVHYVSQYLSTVHEGELVLQTVLRTCVEGLGYDRAILYFHEEPTRRLICHKTFGFSPGHEMKAMAASYDIDHDDCIPTRVFRTGETIFVEDIHSDSRGTPLDLKIAAVGESDCFVFTPIRSHDRLIGILGADTKTSRRPISGLDVESLEILANDAARAIERSDLYGRLVAERNFIKSIVNQMISGIITLDETGKVTWFNPYSEKVFQIRQEDALGKHYRQVFAAIPSWAELIEQSMNSEESGVRSLEHHSILQDGKDMVLEVNFSRIRHEEKSQNMFLVLVRDITRRRQMEDHIRRSDRLVSLGVLAAGIAHEMRNPLTGVSLMMDDLHDHLNDRPQDRELIQRALKEIDRLENLINGLLDFAMPSQGVNLETRPVGDVIENTLFLVKKLCKNQKITLTQQIREALPMVSLDPEKMKQAVLNLLLNAIQAMPDGGSLRLEAVEVPAEESLLSENALRIIVADTGRGIAPEDIPYIFDPFFTRNPSGRGLGLTIVHSIVEEHKGRISVSSQVDKGTTFWIDLPTLEI
ncbi:MAG: GAF domain-containing protein [Syntrophobacteraceae bacterium]|nr:GAF domain-containing protein [Syntrophobacteraceae bacterium]